MSISKWIVLDLGSKHFHILCNNIIYSDVVSALKVSRIVKQCFDLEKHVWLLNK